eukprot:168347-Chlamydomonas_euryale.AAC.1
MGVHSMPLFAPARAKADIQGQGEASRVRRRKGATHPLSAHGTSTSESLGKATADIVKATPRGT